MPLGEHPGTLQLWGLWDERLDVFTPWMGSKEAAAVLRMKHARFKEHAAGQIPRHEVGERRFRYYAPEFAEWLLRR